MAFAPPLSWIGSNDKLQDVQMYMPLIMSVQPLIEKLQIVFNDDGIEYGLIISEIMKNILSETSSENSSYTVLKQLLPQERYNEVKTDPVLHECEVMLVDMVSEFIQADCTDRTFPYYYPHGDMFILYVPTDPKSIADEKLREKLVPYMALRYLDY